MEETGYNENGVLLEDCGKNSQKINDFKQTKLVCTCDKQNFNYYFLCNKNNKNAKNCYYNGYNNNNSNDNQNNDQKVASNCSIYYNLNKKKIPFNETQPCLTASTPFNSNLKSSSSLIQNPLSQKDFVYPNGVSSSVSPTMQNLQNSLNRFSYVVQTLPANNHSYSSSNSFTFYHTCSSNQNQASNPPPRNNLLLCDVIQCSTNKGDIINNFYENFNV